MRLIRVGGWPFRLPPEALVIRRPYGRCMDSTASIERPTLAVQTSGLGKRFGTQAALDGVDLEVPRGSAFGFLGPNGAGKTTLIRLLLGLAEPTAGSTRLLGRELPAQRAAALARVGAIIEEPRFHPHLTGRENLWVHAAARVRSAHGRIDGALARVGLAARADDRVKAYSLGMRQRLGIARGLLADPELLILDEPMNGLDPAGILEFRQLIRNRDAPPRPFPVTRTPTTLIAVSVASAATRPARVLANIRDSSLLGPVMRRA